MKEKAIAISLLATMLLSMFMLPVMAGTPTEPHAANAMWVEPSETKWDTDEMKVGDKFTVTVWLNLTVESDNWQFIMYYNTAWLNATGCGYTHGGNSEFFEGFTTQPVAPQFSYFGIPCVLHAEGLVAEVRPPGYGSLSWVEFEIIAAPSKGECLHSDFDITTGVAAGDTFVENPEGGVEFTTYDGEVDYNYAQPGINPHMAVHNPGPYPYECTTTWFFRKEGNATGQPWNCTWFQVDIYICELDPAWGLTNASFVLSYDPTEIYTDPTGANITIYDPPWNVSSVNVIDGTIEIFVEHPCGLPAGYLEDFPKENSVLVATILFHIFDQGSFPEVDVVPLTFSDEIFYDHEFRINASDPQDGTVTIEGYTPAAPPGLEVQPSPITMGPEPCVCETFNVSIVITDLDARWKAIGFEFKLAYNKTLIEPVDKNITLKSVVEGDWLPQFNNTVDPPYTFLICYDYDDPPIPPNHIKVGYMLLPNATGQWNVFPEGTGVLVTIPFHVIYQCYPLNITTELGLYDIMFIDDEDNEIPVEPITNGIVNIVTALPGRQIDLYTQYPAPFGGQGPNNPSDMFWPQKVIYLYAKVTYNYWPVNNKDVGFEVEGPYDQETGLPVQGKYKIWIKDSARTNKDGIAVIMFQIPWPCEDPEGLFGKWKVTATVDICSEVVMDTLMFDYLYMVMWDDVTVDKEDKQYDHCNTIEITVSFKSKSQQKRWVLISVVLYDELDTPVGIALVGRWVQGAQPCHYVYYTATAWIHVPQHAFAGIAQLRVNAFTKNPTIGGVPWCPGFVTEVYIQPY